MPTPQETAQQVYAENSKSGQFKVGPVQFHKHNGIDSPRISVNDLSGTITQVIGGFATLSTGSVSITDSRIKNTSVITVTPQIAFSANLGAECFNGSATITSTSGGDSRVVNYQILL